MLLGYKKSEPRIIIQPLTKEKIKLIHELFIKEKRVQRNPWL
jgi:hypothetical protein